MGALAHRDMGEMRCCQWQGMAAAQLSSVGSGAVAWSHLKLGLCWNAGGRGNGLYSAAAVCRHCRGAEQSAWSSSGCEEPQWSSEKGDKLAQSSFFN